MRRQHRSAQPAAPRSSRPNRRFIVEDPEAIRGKRVLVVEDGPTLTHGEMAYGAGRRLPPRRFGAAEIVDPRPYAVGTINETFAQLPAHRQRCCRPWATARAQMPSWRRPSTARRLRPGPGRHADRPDPAADHRTPAHPHPLRIQRSRLPYPGGPCPGARCLKNDRSGRLTAMHRQPARLRWQAGRLSG